MNPVQLKVVNPLLMKWGTPTRKTPGAAGYDLVACIEQEVPVPAGASVVIPTGLSIFIGDPDVVAKLYARSGLALKHEIGLTNGVGVIDSDYQGEIQVLIKNQSWEDFIVRPGDRIAQLTFEPVMHPPMAIVTAFETNTVRGNGGFGSTGVDSAAKAALTTDAVLGLA